MPIKMVNGRPFLDPALLRHQVTFLEATAGSDDSGNVVTWAPSSPPDTAWAEIVQVRGSEAIKAGQDVSQVWATITIRYNPSKTRSPKARLQVPGGGIYVVEAIENVLRMNVWLVLTCLALGDNA